MSRVFDSRSEIGHILLPRDCVLCGSESRGQAICAGCVSALPWLPADRCPVCAVPSEGSRVCGRCLAEPPAYERTGAALAYRFPVDALVQAFKYGGNLPLGEALSELLIPILAATERPDAIVPMPLHPARLRDRGFNQALELARRLSKALGVPVIGDACARVRDTPPQASLPWKDREKNIRGAFTCQANLEDRHVAIVDDVMTTGHTLNEVAKALKRKGVGRVSCWVVARALQGP
jgi:ComF family protein